jgi:catechol 2,3-dioxygenase-like lactoylglutathione lyase family enzyme
VAAAAWTIKGARHAGITVSDLDRSLDFYCGKLGLELRLRRLYEEREIAEIVDVTEATAFDIAFLRIPDSDVEIELIEYQGCERRAWDGRPCDYGTGHFAMAVDDIDALYADLSARGVVFRSAGAVEQVSGPRRGGKSVYLHDPDGYIIEFSQRPPGATSDA